MLARSLPSLVAALACAAPPVTASAAATASYRYITLDPPGELNSAGASLNDAGQVVVSTYFQAYLWQNGQFRKLNFPSGAFEINPAQINRGGLIVGTYKHGENTKEGFAYSTLQNKLYVVYRGMAHDFPVSVNAQGLIAGNEGSGDGFLDLYGRFTKIKPPNALDESVAWINDAGVAVGSYFSRSDNTLGFAYRAGSYADISVPGSRYTYVDSVSPSGDFVGFYGKGSNEFGFVEHAGKFRTIAVPGVLTTDPLFENAAGEIVGITNNSPDPHVPDNHVFRVSHGVLTMADPPRSINATVSGLNAAGWFTGYYDGTDSHRHAFVAVCVPAGSRCGD